jgi:hypothetical protein
LPSSNLGTGIEAIPVSAVLDSTTAADKPSITK